MRKMIRVRKREVIRPGLRLFEKKKKQKNIPIISMILNLLNEHHHHIQ